MSVQLITLCLFGSLLLLLALGMPVAFALGSTTVVFAYLLWGPQALYIVPTMFLGTLMNPTLMAIPLFLLMAHMLQHSGVADALFDTLYQWMGGLRGGLAMGTVVICTLFAAISGVSGAATVSMGVIALPAMLDRKYSKDIALGCISAGGVLGIIIPPSVEMVLYSLFSRPHLSVGKMFFGGVVPGLIISSMHITYIGIRSYIQPHLCPPIPREERISLRKKVVSLKSVGFPILLIVAVLGSIYTGAATPTEAAAVGALGTFVCAAVHRRLNWRTVRNAALGTFKISGMCMWIAALCVTFNGLYIGLGAQKMLIELISGLSLNRWVILAGMQGTLFILGMIMDDYAIIMLCAPIYAPIVTSLGFNPLWWGIVFILNMQMAYLTPPFGFNLFYLRGVAPKGITMGDIYHSIIPFTIIQAVGLAIVMVFPQLALWLPSTMV